MPTFPKEFLERLMQEVGNDDELEAILDGLGLNITTADAMNMAGLEEDDDYYDDGATLRLPKADIETYVQEVNKDQLIFVAKRFDPSNKAKTVDSLRKVVNKALKSSKHIKAVVENLNPLEQELLREVKRRGGVSNGWGLILHAVQLGLHPEPVTDTSLYRVDAAKHPGVKFLIPLLRDCLLLPNSTYASWFERHYYGYEQNIDIDNDILQVDERLLDALPDKASPQPLQPKFKVLKDSDTTGFSQKHPIEAVLKLIEVLKLVDASGGLQTNKDGSISKNAIKKLIKLAPWLEEELENYIGFIQSLDFLYPVKENSKITLKLQPGILQAVQNMPIEVTYCTLFDGYVHGAVNKYNTEGYQYGLGEVIDRDLARRVLLDAVSLLPNEAVDLDSALKVMWKERLQYIMKAKRKTVYYGSRSNETEPLSMPRWFRHDILQELHQFGLIAFKETGRKKESTEKAPTRYYPEEIQALDTTNYAIKTTAAKEWWHRGRAFNKAMSVAMQQLKPQDETAHRELTTKLAKEHLGEVDANQKSLLIQANFDILVYLDMLSPSAIAALCCADCTRIDAQTANYTISRSSIYRALETGLTLETIIELLKSNSHDLPNNVTVSITEWAGRRERLSVTENSNLLEYPTTKDRDAALKKLNGSRAVAERFLLAPVSPEVNAVLNATVTTVHNYLAEPRRIIEFQDDGGFKLKGASDLAGRAVLASLAKQDTKGNYALDTTAIQSGAFTKVAKESLLKRTKGGLPAQLSVLIDIWSEKTPAPAVGQVSIFQHASAKELAKHPDIAPLLAGQLGSTSFLVADGKVTELNKALKTLGIVPSKTVENNLEPKVVQKEESMKKGLPTRKMREMIESAISNERNLKLKYNEEKHSYDRYGYTKISKGKSVTEEIVPDSVYYEGSTPYFFGKTLKNDKGRDIRIGYITEIQVL